MTRQVACNGCGQIAESGNYENWTRLSSLRPQQLWPSYEEPTINVDLCANCTRRILSLLTAFPAATETTT